jgi:hypothetical protein
MSVGVAKRWWTHNSRSFQKLCALPPVELGSYHHHIDLDSSTWLSVSSMLEDIYVNQMLLCDNYNGGYHLFCLKPELTQVLVGIWYYSSCSPVAPWFQTMPHFSRLRSGGDTWAFHVSLLLCIVYICAYIYFWLISFYLWIVLVFLFSRVYYRFTPLWHRTSWHYTSRQSMLEGIMLLDF